MVNWRKLFAGASRGVASALSSLMIALFLVASLPAQDDARLLDEIVAKVNQEIITMTDLQKELRLLRLSLQDEFDSPERIEQEFQKRRPDLLKTLIQNKILYQKADELGITVDADQQVNKTVEEIRKQMGIPSLEVLEQALEQRGTSLQEYRANLKERMVIEWLLQQSVYSKLTLLTSEVEEFYQQSQDQFRVPANVTLSEIVFLKEGKSEEEVRSHGQEVYRQLEQGAAFEELAKEYSEGPTASSGGGIGSFDEGSMAENIQNAITALEEGEHTGLLETDYGFVIFKVTEREGSGVKPLEEVKPQIQRILYQQKAQPELKTFLEELIQQSYIYVAPKYRAEYNVEDLTR